MTYAGPNMPPNGAPVGFFEVLPLDAALNAATVLSEVGLTTATMPFEQC